MAEDYYDEEDDWQRDIRLKEEKAILYAEDCEVAYNGIKQMGFSSWFSSYIQTTMPSQKEAKVSAVKNLVKYFSRDDVEMYERCHWLNDSLEKELKRFIDKPKTEEEEEFYDWSTQSKGSGWSRTGGKQKRNP